MATVGVRLEIEWRVRDVVVKAIAPGVDLVMPWPLAVAAAAAELGRVRRDVEVTGDIEILVEDWRTFAGTEGSAP